MSKRSDTKLTPVVVLDEVQARWLSDLSRAAYNYKLACTRVSQEAVLEVARTNDGQASSSALGAQATSALVFQGSVRALMAQKWSIFLIADLEDETKEQAIREVERFTQIAMGPPNTKSIKSLDGFTWFKRGFTLDNF